jgi:hypothetical protein
MSKIKKIKQTKEDSDVEPEPESDIDSDINESLYDEDIDEDIDEDTEEIDQTECLVEKIIEEIDVLLKENELDYSEERSNLIDRKLKHVAGRLEVTSEFYR